MRSRLITSASAAERFHLAEVAIHGASVIGLFVLLVASLRGISTVTVTDCVERTHVDEVNGIMLALVTIGGAAAGRLFTVLRADSRTVLAAQYTAMPSVTVWLQIMLASLLLAVAILLAYETFAVANFNSPQPVTSYVRCAATFFHSIPAALAGIGIGFMLANWLWSK